MKAVNTRISLDREELIIGYMHLQCVTQDLIAMVRCWCRRLYVHFRQIAER